MANLEDLERRLTMLEQRMDQEAGLRASQDRDQADLKAWSKSTNLVVQALHINQQQQTQTLDEHTRTLNELQAGVQQLITMLNTLIARE